MRQIVKNIFERFGYQIKRKKSASWLGYDLEPEADEAIKKVGPYTMLSRERLITLYQNAVFCEQNGIVGSFVECGVWKGGAVALMALANLKHGKTRRPIHLFDSFQEICEPDEKVDGARALKEVKMWSSGEAKGRLKPLVGIYNVFGGPGTLEGNKNLLEKMIGYDPNFLYYHSGWFQETLPLDAGKVGPIAILRLDSDWYASTKICLDYLGDRVVKNGFVVIDDYGTYEGCKKAVDEYRHKMNVTTYMHHIDADGRYWIQE